MTVTLCYGKKQHKGAEVIKRGYVCKSMQIIFQSTHLTKPKGGRTKRIVALGCTAVIDRVIKRKMLYC